MPPPLRADQNSGFITGVRRLRRAAHRLESKEFSQRIYITQLISGLLLTRQDDLTEVRQLLRAAHRQEALKFHLRVGTVDSD
ncbi:hypothetical protein NDU88_006039 [Pleurodeles waltl]|uniref:Uncharacterized protein n=1 Tax=Pleurodeles waltl TaxID=8319 RepID=A0AAV7N2X2_PLEWA|nr:hypothetical protein NDU88_006039 [Pleurodeles waltl]